MKILEQIMSNRNKGKPNTIKIMGSTDSNSSELRKIDHSQILNFIKKDSKQGSAQSNQKYEVPKKS